MAASAGLKRPLTSTHVMPVTARGSVAAQAMAQAQGTQGSLVFTSTDGGRVDTPEAGAALVAALDVTRETGFVVDREGKLAEQRDDVDDRIREQVELKVADELAPQLTALATSLEQATAGMPADQPAAAQLEALAARAQALSTSPDRKSVV